MYGAPTSQQTRTGVHRKIQPVHEYVGCVLVGHAIPELDRRHKNVRQSTVNALALQRSAHDDWDGASFALQPVSSTMKKGNETSFLLAQAWFFSFARVDLAFGRSGDARFSG